MRILKKIKIIIILVSSAQLISCYPNIKPHFIEMDQLAENIQISSPTKVYLSDASVILFSKGFNYSGKLINGFGQRFWHTGKESKSTTQNVHVDSVIAMTYYEKELSGGQVVASFFLGLFGLTQSGVAIYCLSCPKCCFGSCPTVYTFDGNQYHLEAELFSYSISKLLEERDLDLVRQKIPDNGLYKIRITNEALETHYLNQFSLLTVNHPIGTQVFPSGTNQFVMINHLSPPDEVLNSKKNDVLDQVISSDNKSYRSELEMLKNLENGPTHDWLKIKKNLQFNTDSVTMVIRYKNTLLSTILFYDVVLASQGISAIEWTRKMNEDLLYATQFNLVYKNFSGISVLVPKNKSWVKINSIPDAGPITWKYMATKIPVDEEGNINIKLQFFPDNFMIDYIAFDTDHNTTKTFTINEHFPVEIREDSHNNILHLIENDDDKYLTTNPGESFLLLYDIPKEKNIEQTVFIKSKGYYTEWIRGSWVRNTNLDYRFDLFDVNRTLQYLATSWIQNKDFIEQEFFHTRIPVKEVP